MDKRKFQVLITQITFAFEVFVPAVSINWLDIHHHSVVILSLKKES